MTSIPSSILFPGDDEYAIAVEVVTAQIGEEQLGVLDLQTGSLSELLPVSEPPAPPPSARMMGVQTTGAVRYRVNCG